MFQKQYHPVSSICYRSIRKRGRCILSRLFTVIAGLVEPTIPSVIRGLTARKWCLKWTHVQKMENLRSQNETTRRAGVYQNSQGEALGKYGETSVIAWAIRFFLRNPYESLVIVDENGVFEYVDKGSEKFLGLEEGGAKGVKGIGHNRNHHASQSARKWISTDREGLRCTRSAKDRIRVPALP